MSISSQNADNSKKKMSKFTVKKTDRCHLNQVI